MVLFPGGLDEEPSCSAGPLGLIPGSGRSPEEENGNPLQYSCLENPKDRGIPWNYKESDTTEQHTHTHTHTHSHIHKGAQQRFTRALSKTQTKASSHFLKMGFEIFFFLHCSTLL